MVVRRGFHCTRKRVKIKYACFTSKIKYLREAGQLLWKTSFCSRFPNNRYCGDLESGLRQTANVNLYHVTKFCLLYFSFTVHYFFSKISSLTLVLAIRTVLDSLYLFIFCFEKFSTTFAVNLTLNMSFYSKSVICSEHTFD